MAKIQTDLVQHSSSGAQDIPVVIAMNEDGTGMDGSILAVDGVITTDMIQQPATGGARPVGVAIVVNADGSPISAGGSSENVTWGNISGKPPYVAAGATQAAAREVIGAGTSNLSLGTTSGTAKAGDYQPTWSQVTNKPAVMAVGATQEEARNAIGALAASSLGQPGGVAQLDDTGSIPLDQLNVSSLEFKGAWNPTTNTPSLINGTGETGQFYKASADGTYNFGNGEHVFVEGDWVMFAAGVWQRLGSKETVASVNGKMGAVVLTAADVGALPDTYVPTLDGVSSFNGDKGDITYTPDWESITGKPNLVVQRGPMSPAVPAALLRRSTAISYPSGKQIIAWNQPVYDNFGGVSGNTYVVPSWAGFARVTVYVRLTIAGDGQYLYAYALKNGADIAMIGHPVIANTTQAAVIISPIIPVTAGDILTGALYHNSPGNRTLVHGESGSYMQIELFEGPE